MPNNNNRKAEDFLDDFFNEIISDLTGGETASEFANRMHTTISDSLNSNGFEDLSELLHHGVRSANKYVGPKAETSSFVKPERIVDALTFIQNELSMIRYDLRHRGAFKDGHEEALKNYYGMLHKEGVDLPYLEVTLREEIEDRKRSSRYHDRFSEGYNAGLNDLLKIISNAKKYMMTKVKNDLNRTIHRSSK